MLGKELEIRRLINPEYKQDISKREIRVIKQAMHNKKFNESNWKWSANTNIQNKIQSY